MNIIKENKVYILILLVNLMFTFSIVAQSYLMVDFSFLPLIGIFSISAIVYFLFDFIFKKVLHKILFLFVIIIIGLLYIYYFGVAADLYVQVNTNVIGINDAVKSTSVTYYEQYKIFFLWLIPIMVFVFLAFANRGVTNLVLIYSILVMTLFWYLGFTKIVKGNLFIFTFIGVVSFGINNCIGGLRKLKKTNPNISINSGIILLIFLIPALVISVATTKLPKEYKGNYIEIINAKFINRKFVDTFTLSKNSLIKFTYGLEVSGYLGNTGRLGGSININDNLVLSVKANKAEYLRGSVKDNYNGFEWSKSKSEYSLKVNGENSIFTSNAKFSEYLHVKNKLIVYPEKGKNSSIFAPIYTYNVQLENKGTVYYDSMPTFLADLSKVKSYSVNYYDTLETQTFENCLKSEWLNTHVAKENPTMFKQKYANYLQVPSTITQRTRDLIEPILMSQKNKYYSVLSIKEYLDKNYSYTTNVNSVPEDQDFIDNFLLTEKKGYCVYFATAATIACRMGGIPARYVEGFKMPESKALDGLYKVTNKEAHAWCEVLVDPDMDLWATLEVTPSSVSAFSTPTVPAGLIPKQRVPNNNLQNISKNNYLSGNYINIGSYKFSKFMIAISIFLSIIILISTKILIVLVQIKKVLKEKSTIPYYKYCMKRLKKIGINKPNNLADLEYVETLEDNDLKAILKEIVVTTYGEFYGKKSNKYSNRTNSYKYIEAYIKKNQNKIIYIIKKYFFF